MFYFGDLLEITFQPLLSFSFWFYISLKIFNNVLMPSLLLKNSFLFLFHECTTFFSLTKGI